MARWRRHLATAHTRLHPTLEISGRQDFEACIELGPGCTIERDVTIWLSADAGAMPRLELGEHVFVGRNTYLGAYQPIRIGAHASIGAYSYFISGNHRYDTREIPIHAQGYAGAPIQVEEDAWISTHVVILPGVRIGRGAIIGAGSVVTKNVGPYEIWAGTPARFLKLRP